MTLLPLSYIRIDEDSIAQIEKLGLIARLLSKVLPNANPDFGPIYPQVTYWHLEIQGTKPIREIGFNRSGEPVVLGPFGANYGMWTDSPVLIEPSDYPSVSKDLFVVDWLSLSTRFDEHTEHELA